MASLRLFKFIFICSFILIPFLGAAAELSWNGGPITVGNGDRLVITDGMPQSADNVTVEEGGTLVIANNLQITNSFNNKGTIQVTGYLNIPESVSAVENTGTMIFSPLENLEDAGATAGFDTARVALKNSIRLPPYLLLD